MLKTGSGVVYSNRAQKISESYQIERAIIHFRKWQYARHLLVLFSFDPLKWVLEAKIQLSCDGLMHLVSPNTTNTFLYSFIGNVLQIYTKLFLGLLHQTVTFTNYQSFPFILHELRDVDKSKVVFITYFCEKSEKFAKNTVFC